MICLNTLVFIKLLDFVLLIKYALYIAANYMRVLTITEEKYFVAFVKLKVILAEGILYFTGVTPHQMSSLHKNINYL